MAPRRYPGVLAILLATLAMLAAACAPAAPPSPTAAPAKPAEPKPAATLAPAKPAEAPAAKPAATTAPAKTQAKPAATSKPAEKFPTKPINWIVPYGPGAFDALSRGLAPVLSKELGVPVVVENVPGAEGFNRVFRATPDGHTLGVAEIVGEYFLRIVQQQVYDISKFTVLGRFNEAVNMVTASPKAPFKTIQEMRATKESVRCGLFGGFGLPAAHCFLLMETYGLPYGFVKFPSPAEAVLGITRGDADITTAGTVLWLDHIAKGNAVPMLLWSTEPDSRVPGVPNLKDIGLPELVSVSNQRAILAPPGMPADRLEAVSTALDKAIKSAEYHEFLVKGKWETNGLVGEPFRKLLAELTAATTKYSDAAKRAAAKT